MALNTGQTKTALHDILKDSYVDEQGKLNEDALKAAEYFVAVYIQWGALVDALPTQEVKMTFDRIVCMIFHGEAHKIPVEVGRIIDHFSQPEKLKEFTIFITGLMSGEVLSNPFVMQYRDRLNAAIVADAFNEAASRHLSDKTKEAASINRWLILSVIAGIVGGTDAALRLNFNLKEAYANGR